MKTDDIEAKTYLNYLKKIYHGPRLALFNIQKLKLQKILKFVCKNSPFYKEIFEKNNLYSCDNVVFEKIPFLTKDKIKENFLNGLVCKKNHKIINVGFTSGSFAQRTPFAYLWHYQRFVKKALSFIENSLWRWGDEYLIFTSLHCSRNRSSCGQGEQRFIPPYVREIKIPTSNDILNDGLMEERIKIIKESGAILIHADPFYLRHLAKFIEKNKKQKEVKNIKFISSTYSLLTDANKKYLEKIFKARVFDNYGCSEVGPIANSCRSDNKHILEESVLVEIDKINEDFGEIIVTDLDNYVMPLIRYRTGDLGRIKNIKCPCGNPARVLEIEGRLSNCLAGGGRIFTEKMIDNIMSEFEQIDFYQITSEGGNGTLEFDIVLNKKMGKEFLYRKLSDVFKNFELKINFVDAILPEPSGKYQLVKILRKKLK